MKKIIIFILITVLMLLSCKNNSTNVDTSSDNNNGNNTGENNNNGGSTVTPEELEKYGIDIASATTQTIEEALIKYETDHKGEYKLIFKGNSPIEYTRTTSIAGLLNEITLKNISITVNFEKVNFQNNKLSDLILQGPHTNLNVVKVVLPDTITTIGKYAFFCANLTNVNIPKNLKTIENSAFDKLKMENIILPDGLQTIGRSAFSVCYMKTVVIPDSVTSIGDNAFSRCTNLIEVKLSNNLTSLEKEIFSSSSALKSITIPASITEIKGLAFYYAKALETVIFLSPNPPNIEESAFDSTALKTIYVPKGSETLYETLKGKYGIPDNINIIGQ
ncbi:leucine-rich repeat domain-containing protein [Brachyspira pilosicoli]|uniref:leucine-rich repeat domain-containing protein n=1 Tax=Brachyspira pilosicoli TaxID=52584 RepID=UPI002542B716|nr:leucine-rich repeat domain-containing protein [Brachyspira pilosicoli]WIH85455.1 leucine-rich repeat domain-containing protein [Brachyspira pilosicoli]